MWLKSDEDKQINFMLQLIKMQKNYGGGIVLLINDKVEITSFFNFAPCYQENPPGNK